VFNTFFRWNVYSTPFYNVYNAVRFNRCVLTSCANCAKNIGKRAKQTLEKNKLNVENCCLASVVLKICLAVIELFICYL
jgi:hypothetical protein